MDVIDARRRGDGVAQAFSTEEALLEYTKRTTSHFPYNSPKAGELLRRILRKSREDTIKDVSESPLFPPPHKRNNFSARDKISHTSVKEEGSRSAKKHRMIAESRDGND